MTGLTALQKNLAAKLPDVALRNFEPMHEHTSFRIGGNAEVMAFPKSVEQLRDLLITSALLDCKWRILGAGTNILVPDEGVDGIVINLKDAFHDISLIDDRHISCMAGATMTRAAVFAANNGLAGLEFAHGIPGTVGGGVYMNAGAYGGEISQVCESIEVMGRNGSVHTLYQKDLDFSYRHSILTETDDIILSAVFCLQPGNSEEIRSRMKELMAKRSASQPLNLPSAGSAFKRPAGAYAAALIDQAGLKGLCVGGAEVSVKHAGFIVNRNGATASDVRELLQQVSDCVYSQFGIRLEPEIRIW